MAFWRGRCCLVAEQGHVFLRGVFPPSKGIKAIPYNCIDIKANILFDPQISFTFFWFSKKQKRFGSPQSLVGPVPAVPMKVALGPWVTAFLPLSSEYTNLTPALARALPPENEFLTLCSQIKGPLSDSSCVQVYSKELSSSTGQHFMSFLQSTYPTFK